MWAIDKNIVALDVPMDDWWIVRMQVSQAFEYLPSPSLYDLNTWWFEFGNVLSQSARSHQLRDEYKFAVIVPRLVKIDDIRMPHFGQNFNLLA